MTNRDYALGSLQGEIEDMMSLKGYKVIDSNPIEIHNPNGTVTDDYRSEADFWLYIDLQPGVSTTSAEIDLTRFIYPDIKADHAELFFAEKVRTVEDPSVISKKVLATLAKIKPCQVTE
jgi:hypothetical protein